METVRRISHLQAQKVYQQSHTFNIILSTEQGGKNVYKEQGRGDEEPGPMLGDRQLQNKRQRTNTNALG